MSCIGLLDCNKDRQKYVGGLWGKTPISVGQVAQGGVMPHTILGVLPHHEHILYHEDLGILVSLHESDSPNIKSLLINVFRVCVFVLLQHNRQALSLTIYLYNFTKIRPILLNIPWLSNSAGLKLSVR